MRALVSDSMVTFMVDGKQVVLNKGEVGFDDVIQAIKDKNEDFLKEVANDRFSVQKPLFTKIFGDRVTLVDGKVEVDGVPVGESLSRRIQGHVELGLSVEPLVNFVAKVRQNPSGRSQLELFDFLEGKNLPLDDDGDFYAYKCVGSDYYSKRAGNLRLLHGVVDSQGRIYNAPGEYIECERGGVDDDRNNECSFGLHAGRLEYATQFYYQSGDKVVVIKINPKDVVSVPRDYNASKLRTCAYKVVEDYTGPLPDYTLDQNEYEEDDWYDDLEDEWDEGPNPSDCCGGNVSCCQQTSVEHKDVRSDYIPQRGDIISFSCHGSDHDNVVVCDVVGNQVYGGNRLGFGSWNTSEMQNVNLTRKNKKDGMSDFYEQGVI